MLMKIISETAIAFTSETNDNMPFKARVPFEP